MTGIFGFNNLIFLVAVTPSISGIWISIKTKSYLFWFVLIISTASVPSLAKSQTMLRFFSILDLVIKRLVFSSSTIRIFLLAICKSATVLEFKSVCFAWEIFISANGGNSKENFVHFPTSDSQIISPPNAIMLRLQNARPKPVPSFLPEVKKSANILWIMSAEIPGPVSWT